MSYPIPGTRRRGSVAEAVIAAVRLIPPGRVMSYGDVAEFVGNRSGRMVGRVLATYAPGRDDDDDDDDDNDEPPWHRVVRADGSVAEHLRSEQLQRLRAEGVPVDGERVRMSAARWDGRPARRRVVGSRHE